MRLAPVGGAGSPVSQSVLPQGSQQPRHAQQPALDTKNASPLLSCRWPQRWSMWRQRQARRSHWAATPSSTVQWRAAVRLGVLA